MTARTGQMGVEMSAYERLEPSFAELDSGDEHFHEIFQDDYEPEDEKPKRRIPFLIIGSLLLVAIVGGGLAFAYKQGVREGNRSAPPVIRTSDKPLKVKPVQPGGIIIPNQNKLVYDRLDGKPAKITERLMPAPEDVMDLPRKPVQDRMPANTTPGADTNPAPAPGGPVVEGSRVEAVPVRPSGPMAKAPLQSREVETVTITPEGIYRNTVPSAEEPTPEPRETVIAAIPRAEEPPVVSDPKPVVPPLTGNTPVISEIRPAVPDSLPPNVPGDAASSRTTTPVPDGAAKTDGGMSGMTGSTEAPASTTTVEPLQPEMSASTPRESVMAPGAGEPAAPPAQDEATSGTSAPVIADGPPLPRPNPLRNTHVASVEPAAPEVAEPAKTTDAAPAPKPVASGNYVVQIASHRRQIDALKEFAQLQRGHPNIIGDHQPLIQKADLGERGIFFRLRIGPLETKADAVELCRSLKNAGKDDCLIRRR